MMPYFSALLEIVTIVTSIFLIIAGISKSEKYSANSKFKKELLIFGVVLLILTIIIGIPDFIDGWKAGN